MISVGSNILSLKYQRLTLSGCKDIGIRKFDSVATTQFLRVGIIRDVVKMVSSRKKRTIEEQL